jgi:hypothetical protein
MVRPLAAFVALAHLGAALAAQPQLLVDSNRQILGPVSAAPDGTAPC